MGDITVGDTPILSRRVGNSEVLKVYVGNDYIWPPVQKVTFVGSLISTTNTGVWPTGSLAGDLAVFVAVNNSTNTVPTLPVGYTSVYTSPATDTLMPMLMGYRVSTGGTISNVVVNGASNVITFLFRGVDTVNPFGAIASQQTAANAKGGAPGITPVNTRGESMVVQNFINNASTGSFAVNAQPAGWQSRNRNARMVTNTRIDSRTVKQTFETLLNGGTANWRGVTFELLPPSGVQYVSGVTVSGATVTLPAHQPGDLLVIIAQIQNSTAAFSPNTPPHTGGTVPEWIDGYNSNISSVQGDAHMSMKMGYAVATANNHTSGTWTNSTFTTAMVFRNVDPNNPIGGLAGLKYQAPATGANPQYVDSPSINLSDTSGHSQIMYYYAISTTNANPEFAQAPPDGFTRIIQNNKSAIQAKKVRTSDGVCSQQHTTLGAWFRSMVFEVKNKPGAEPTPDGLYDVKVEYLPNYTVKFTALTSYPDDPEDAFFFRATPLDQNDGYKGRTWTETFTPSAGWQTGTVQDYWGGPGGAQGKTVTFQFAPKP